MENSTTHQLSDNSDDDYEPAIKIPKLNSFVSDDGKSKVQTQTRADENSLDVSTYNETVQNSNGLSNDIYQGDGDSTAKHKCLSPLVEDSFVVNKSESFEQTVEYNSWEDTYWSNTESFEEKLKKTNVATKGITAAHPNATNGGVNTDEIESNSVSASENNVTKPSVKRIDSVQKDAEIVSSILGRTDIDNIYTRLAEKRTQPDRLQVVTNDFLENNGTIVNSSVHEEENSDIFSDVDSVLRLLRDKQLHEKVDPNEIFNLLEVNSGKDKRTYAVFHIMLNKFSSSHLNNTNNCPTIEVPPESDLVDCVNKVLKVLPSVNPLEVFQMLESRPDCPERVQNIINDLKAKFGSHSTVSTQSESQDELRDPLIVDVMTISSMFPEKDKNEIYAYLEAHHDKPNRIQLVTEELLRIESGSQPASFQDEIDSASVPSKFKSGETLNSLPDSPQKSAHPVDLLQKDVAFLMNVFPDCEPNYLYSKLEDYSDISNRVEKISAQMFENRNYPKLKEFLEQQKKSLEKRKLQNLQMTVPEFLHMFSDPFKVFLDKEKPLSENYQNHALTQLKNCFPIAHHRYCEQLLEAHNGHFTPSFNQLELECQINHGQRGTKVLRKHPRKETIPMPEVADEYFYKEYWFATHQNEIRDYINECKNIRESRIAYARENKELMECNCCFDDEVLFEDMAACAEGHLFCKECIQRSSSEIIGQAKVKFPCLGADCESQFPTVTLQQVLPHATFSNLLKKVQAEEIMMAAIPGLESCPFCNFATIMPEEDKLFKCLNPECLKESCRLCKEPNHIPLKCEEVEQSRETNMRTFIEKRMTEAMIRICWSCKKGFYKVDGCNKMTCTCGASMCYVCREPINDYEHFQGNIKCAQYTDVAKLHQEEVEKAAKEAREKFVDKNPDFKDIKLKYDPLVNVKNIPAQGSNETYDNQEDYEGSAEEGSYDSDDSYY